MGTTWDYSQGRYVRDDQVKSQAVYIADPGDDQDIPIFRFPVSGSVVAGWVIPTETQAGSETNYWQVGLLDMGSGSAPAEGVNAILAAQVGGTIGWTAGTVVAFSIEPSVAAFAAGDWVGVDYDETGTVAPAFTIQIDYRLDS